ncbi:hypothetical protein AXA65_08410 [Chryseobacterium sp. FP211-J200]|nr:hypothetical protein AXA65_08410 [Chryseobacterium sp. FP211-J200]
MFYLKFQFPNHNHLSVIIWATAKSQNFPRAILSPGYPLQSFAFHDLSSVDAFPGKRISTSIPVAGFHNQSTFHKKKTIYQLMTNCRLVKTTKTQRFHKAHNSYF